MPKYFPPNRLGGKFWPGKNKEAELAASANLSVQLILPPQLLVSAAHQGVCWTQFFFGRKGTDIKN